MWRALSASGARVREVRVEGGGKDRDLVIVPEAGERLRIIATGDVAVETLGRVTVRTGPIDAQSVRVTFSGERLVLERAEVLFDGSERDWENLWRRARTRSRPWWTEIEGGEELDLDWAMQVRLTIAGP
jgi:hypothetical protein